MTAQDPELSAALGWPGGISDPVLDRTRLLQMVAALRLASKQALEALELEMDTRRCKVAIAALRAALAQKEEPVQVAERERIAAKWDGCVTHQLDAFGPVNIGASIRAGELGEAQQDSACLHGVDGACKECYATETDLSRCPQCNGPADNGFDRSFPPSPYLCTKCMAEPVEPVAWECRAGGLKPLTQRQYDAQTVATKRHYTRIAPPRRTMVPLTAQELDGVIERHVGGSEITDDMYTSMEQFARAVEQASWEKNHGKA